MRRLIFNMFVAVLALAGFSTSAFAEDVLVLMSIKTAGYMELLRSADNSCKGASTRVVNLAENSEIDIAQLVRSSRARVVVAVGDKAYQMASSAVLRVPVIAAMVQDRGPRSISYLAPPEMFLSAMKKSGRKRVGIIYGRNLNSYVRNAAEMAKGFGITLVRREASTPIHAIEQLASLNDQIDALWILPDNSILTAGSAETMLVSAQVSNIPVFAFASNYLKIGAALIIEPDRGLIGKEVGEAVCGHLNGSGLDLMKRDVYRQIENSVVIDRLRLSKN